MRKPVFKPDTNRAIQLQKMARGFEFRIEEEDVAKTKALISCTFTAQKSATDLCLCFRIFEKQVFS